MPTDQTERSPVFPFGAYDIFSYIIPGSTALLCIFCFEFWCRSNLTPPVRTPLVSIFQLTATDLLKDNIALSALYLLALLCVVYVFGHIVSSISSLCLDRMYTAKGHGYPYETLLKFPPESGPRKIDSMGFYRGLFFWINLYLSLRFLSFFYDSSQLHAVLMAVELILVFTTFLKMIVTFYRGRRESLSKYADFPRLKRLVHIYLAKLFPIGHSILSRLIQNQLRTNRPFDDNFLTLYKRYFKDTFKLEPLRAGTNNFWLCKLFVADQSPVFDRYLNYWLHMYSYARNLSTSFYLAFIYGFWWVYIHQNLIRKDPRTIETLTGLPLIYLSLSFVLLMRFRYIYVGYYNRFLFRAFVYLNEEEEEKESKSLRAGPAPAP